MRLCLIAVLASVLSLILSPRAFSQGESVTVGMIIEQSRATLTSIIEEAEQSGDFLLSRTGQESLLLLDAFEDKNSALLDTAFDKVKGERRQFLVGAQHTVDMLDKGRIDTLARSESMVDQLYQLGQDITFRNYPVVFRYRGTVVSPIVDTDYIRVRIKGANLHVGQPYLSIADDHYPAKRISTQELLIEIPREKLPKPQHLITSFDGELILFRKTGGFLGLFKKMSEVHYQLNFLTLPEEIGKAAVTYRLLETETMQNTLSGEWSHHGRNGCESNAMTPSAPDRRFDLKKSRIWRHSGNSRGHGDNIVIRTTGASMKICVSRRLEDRDDGFAHYKYELVETWDVPKSSVMESTDTISWDKDLSLPLGSEVEEVIVTVYTFWGGELAFTPSSSPANKYFTVTFDDQNILIIRPRIPNFISEL